MSELLIKKMVTLLKEKQELLVQILKYTKDLSKVVDTEDVRDIRISVELKQIIIDKVDKVDEDFYKAFSELKQKENIDEISQLDLEKYPQAKEIKEKTKEILLTFKEIKKIEDDNLIRANISKNKLKVKLKEVNRGKKIINGYNAYNNAYVSVMIDQKK